MSGACWILKEQCLPWTVAALSSLAVVVILMGFPGGSVLKSPPANAGDAGSVLGLGRSTGERNGNPLQSSCLENSMDRRAWWGAVHRVAKSRTRLSDSAQPA